MKTLTSLVLLAAAVPASAQVNIRPMRMMPGVAGNVIPAAGMAQQYNLTPSVVQGQTIPSVTYPQQFSTYSTGNQVVGGSVMTNGSIPRPGMTQTYQQPYTSNSRNYNSGQQTMVIDGNTYVRGTNGVYYQPSQMGSVINSQPTNSSTIYSQPMTNGVTYSQPATNYGTVYSQPYTTSTTNGYRGGSMVGSQNKLYRTSTGFVGKVVRTPFRVVRGVFR